MPIFKKRSILGGMTVKEAMQHQVVALPGSTIIKQCVHHMIKFKANAVMVEDCAVNGVVSRTDIMGAYYAGLPADTQILDIMVGPPHFCLAQDSIETAIDQMQSFGIHQIYVRSEKPGAPPGLPQGTVTYSDIVGLLYRYCRGCMKSGRHFKSLSERQIPRLIVKDVMTGSVASCDEHLPVFEVIEILSARTLGAMLVTDENGTAIGIISKTDLILAYIRGITSEKSAKEIMKTPVATCRADALLSDAIQQMFLSDIQRIFVTKDDKGLVAGVLSLSDATRFRSGTCKACAAGRILDKP